MTVRVSNPTFNLREKLTELDKPSGLKGNEILRSETSQEVRDLIGAGRKNIIINGSFTVDQRYGGATVSAEQGLYGVDRWKSITSNNNKFSMDREGADGTAFGNFTTYMRLTTTSAHTVGSSQFFLLWQTIEAKNMFDRTGFGQSGAKDLSLSFWVRSSVSGPFSGALENVVQNRSFVWEVNIDSENVWEYKTVRIPAINEGSWPRNTASAAAYLMFSLGTTITRVPNQGWHQAQGLGSPTEVKRVQISGATLDLTGIQLEVAKEATGFEYRSFAEELSLCKRYYQQVGPASSSAMVLTGAGNGTARIRGMHQLIPEMRTAPTVTHDTSSENPTFYAYNASPPSYSSVNGIVSTSKNIHWDFNTSTHNQAGFAFDVKGSGAKLQINAEL